jgi:hypothetical protein
VNIKRDGSGELRRAASAANSEFRRNLKSGRFRCLRTKLHPRVNLVLTGFDESQARIKPLCRISVDYLQMQHCTGRPAVLDQSANQFAANSLAAMLGQQGNIEKAPCAGFTLYDDAANWLMVFFNDLIFRIGIGGLIPLLLRIELHAEESFLLNSTPPKTTDFFHSSTGVQPEKEIPVIWQR